MVSYIMRKMHPFALATKNEFELNTDFSLEKMVYLSLITKRKTVIKEEKKKS